MRCSVLYLHEVRFGNFSFRSQNLQELCIYRDSKDRECHLDQQPEDLKHIVQDKVKWIEAFLLVAT